MANAQQAGMRGAAFMVGHSRFSTFLGLAQFPFLQLSPF